MKFLWINHYKNLVTIQYKMAIRYLWGGDIKWIIYRYDCIFYAVKIYDTICY